MNNKIMLKNKRDCYLKNRIEHFDIFRRNTPYHFVFIQINLNHVYDLKIRLSFPSWIALFSLQLYIGF